MPVDGVSWYFQLGTITPDSPLEKIKKCVTRQHMTKFYEFQAYQQYGKKGHKHFTSYHTSLSDFHELHTHFPLVSTR